MIGEDYKAKFVAFLITNNAATRFFLEFGRAWGATNKEELAKSWHSYCNIRTMSANALLIRAFDWDDTLTEDAQYWFELNQKWKIHVLNDMTGGVSAN